MRKSAEQKLLTAAVFMEERATPSSSICAQSVSVLSDGANSASLQSESRREREPSADPALVAAALDDGELREEDVSVKREAPAGLWGDEQEDPYVRDKLSSNNAVLNVGA